MIRSAVPVLALLVFVPSAPAQPPPVVAASIILTKTVGLGAGCAPTNDITVPLGSNVTYCYQVGNNGNTNLMTHTLVDDQLGTLIGPNAVFDLQPGQVFTHMQSAGPIVSQVINTATWTAITNVAGEGTMTATSTAMATVTVLEDTNEACSDEIDNDNQGGTDCEDPTCFGVPVCSRNPVPVAGSWGMFALALVLLGGGMVALTMRRRSV